MHDKTAVIIGAGVTGLSTAYHLAKKRYGRIILIDKSNSGDGSSSRAAGIITGLLWSETGVEARKISLRLFRELSHELEGYHFRDVGVLNLFDPVSWKRRESLLPLYERCGAPFEILDSSDIRLRWPDLHPPDDFIGLFDPLGGYSEPDEYLPALKTACIKAGVEIRENEPVTDFVLRSGEMRGVVTANEMLYADAVVSTIYGWTNVMFSKLGLQLPVKTVVHQRYTTTPLKRKMDIPAVNADPFLGYFRPASGGSLLFGIETPEREEWRITSPDFHLDMLLSQQQDKQYTASALKDAIKSNFHTLLPLLHSLKWESAKTGLLTFSMDGEPILGAVKEVPGLFVGVAFHSGGFAYNPVTGRLLAELVADGKTSINIDSFSPGRFTQEQTAAYLRKTVCQKDVSRRRH